MTCYASTEFVEPVVPQEQQKFEVYWGDIR